MKTPALASLAFAVAAGLAANATPVVSDVSIAQNPGTTLVTVKYRLSGDPGVITLDIQTNYTDGAETKWASIGPENMLGFGGDVHQIVQPTVGDEFRTIHWSPETYWPGPPRTAGTTRAVVTAWATNAPPDYMVVHLVSPYDVTYYPYKEMVPGGITNIMYKGEYMAFRKIPAKGVTWMAGLPTNHIHYDEASCPHRVMLTDDYYMAVYELTTAQNNAISGSAPGSNHRPAASTYTGARGTVEGLNWPSYRQDGSFDYEVSHGVRSTSTLGKLRAMTGLSFDLPTEHQWEYACRAGSPGTIYTDTTPTLILSVSDADTVATLKRICRYSSNNKTADCEGLVNENGGSATVGSYEPNVWGLYDMLGNVHEVCLDWYDSWGNLYSDETKVYVDPVGPARGENTKVIYRGYHYSSTPTANSTVIGNGKWAISMGGRLSMSRTFNGGISATEGVRFSLTLH